MYSNLRGGRSLREAQVVSLWELEWEEVQERERWEVEEVEGVEGGRGKASEEVATARPLLVHFTEVEEDSTCEVYYMRQGMGHLRVFVFWFPTKTQLFKSRWRWRFFYFSGNLGSLQGPGQGGGRQ